MSKSFAYSFHRFGPTRAEEITGVVRDTQRDWRRMGYLPSAEGMARYDLVDLCELWVLKACADVGFGPKRAKAFSRGVAVHIAWHCLRLMGAYEGDHLDAPLSDREKTFKQGKKTYPASTWARKSRWLADAIIGPEDRKPANLFFVIWPNGDAYPTDEVYGVSIEPSHNGAIIVLPMESAARWLVQKAAEPLVDVTFEKEPKRGENS